MKILKTKHKNLQPKEDRPLYRAIIRLKTVFSIEKVKGRENRTHI